MLLVVVLITEDGETMVFKSRYLAEWLGYHTTVSTQQRKKKEKKKSSE